MNACLVCQYETTPCPNMRPDGSHVSCSTCTGPIHPVLGCISSFGRHNVAKVEAPKVDDEGIGSGGSSPYVPIEPESTYKSPSKKRKY